MLRLLAIATILIGCRHYNDKFEQDEVVPEVACQMVEQLIGEPVPRAKLLEENICPPLKTALESNLLLTKQSGQMTELTSGKPLGKMHVADLLCSNWTCTEQQLRWNEASLGTIKASEGTQNSAYRKFAAELTKDLSENDDVAVRIDNRIPALQATGLLKMLKVRTDHAFIVGQNMMLPGGVRQLGDPPVGIPKGVRISLTDTAPNFKSWQTWGSGVLSLVNGGQKTVSVQGGSLVGTRITLQNGRFVINDKIFFKTGSANIDPKSYSLLDQLASIISSLEPTPTVLVQGHTDNVGDPAKNLGLSQKRAAAVKSYLVRKKIPAANLVAEGFGQSKPVSFEGKPEGWDDTPAGRSQNRRVEFVVKAVQ